MKRSANEVEGGLGVLRQSPEGRDRVVQVCHSRVEHKGGKEQLQGKFWKTQ